MKKLDQKLFELLVQNHISNAPEMRDENIIQWGKKKQNIIEHYNSYLNTVSEPNSFGPIEKHPYLEKYLEDFDITRKILLLGTFPPSTYFNSLGLNGLPNRNIQTNNPIDYYYGNMSDLWEYLFGIKTSDIKEIKNRLMNNSIAISDVFLFVQRKNMNSAADNNYRNIIGNSDLLKVFNAESKVETILFTSGSLSNLNQNTTNTLTGFKWILEESKNGISQFDISGDINGNGPYYPIASDGITKAVTQQNGHIIWWIKKGNKKIRIINLPSPSRSASIKIPSSAFFKKWVIDKANNSKIPFPNDAQLSNLMNSYLPTYPNVFKAPYTKHYREVIYCMVLNNTIHTIK